MSVFEFEKRLQRRRPSEKEELKKLRAEKQVRDLCESLDFSPTPLQLKALLSLDSIDRPKLIKDLKAPRAVTKKKRMTSSGTSHTVDVQESRRRSSGAEPDFSDRSDSGLRRRIRVYQS